jgi:two-component system phosphate regulon response regulator PhoB
MASVLIVEHDDGVGALLEASFRQEGFEAGVCRADDAAARAVSSDRPDLLVLNWSLPDASGAEICRRIRIYRPSDDLPVIAVSARADDYDRHEVLDAGANDYLPRPFAIQALIARSHALLRPDRIEPRPAITVGDIEMNLDSYRVFRRGKEVHLGPTEFRILELLMRTPSRVYTRPQILDAVWPSDTSVDERVIDVHLGRLRRTLNSGRRPAVIRTVRGTGYSLQ